MNHIPGHLAPATVCEVLDLIKAVVVQVDVPLRPMTIAANIRDVLDAAMRAEREAEKRKAKGV